jgi:hypothetical protein
LKSTHTPRGICKTGMDIPHRVLDIPGGVYARWCNPSLETKEER